MSSVTVPWLAERRKGDQAGREPGDHASTPAVAEVVRCEGRDFPTRKRLRLRDWLIQKINSALLD